MYCPKDGTHIGGPEDRLVTGTCAPCLECGTMWRWDGGHRRLGMVMLVDETTPEPPDTVDNIVDIEHLEEALKAEGAGHRALGVDALVASIVDTMERTALKEGTCTYYTGTYAVSRETLANAGLTCEKKPDSIGLPLDLKFRWVSFMGDDWEAISREQAIEALLAERS